MAQLTKADFYTKWQSLFLNNTKGLISEARMRDFATDIRDSFVSQVGFQDAPALPSGVSWVEVPSSNIVGNIYYIGEGKINVNGNIIIVPQDDFSLPYASEGKHRLDAIVIDYTDTNNPFYLRLAGDEVNVYEDALRPIISPNYLFVQDADVQDGTIETAATGTVKSISINSGTPSNPNAAGNINIDLIPVADTYANIATLKNNGKLIQGQFYKITDNQTIHTIPNTTALNVQGTVYANAASWTKNLSEGVEELILLAVTSSAFAPVVYSPLFPQDIIQFDFNNVLCEDGITERRGKITYRKDTIKGLETYYDWRNVKFRRWKANPPVWSAGTTYSRGAAVLASDGGVYVSKKFGNNSNVGNDPNLAAYSGTASTTEWAVKTDPNWLKVLVPSRSLYLSTSPNNFPLGFATIPALASDFQDSYTFNTNIAGSGGGAMRNISIGFASTYNNIIFTDNSINGVSPANSAGDGNSFHDNSFDLNCTNMTFNNGEIYGNSFGKLCTGNIIQGGFIYNLCDNNFSFNHFVLVRSGGFGTINRNFFAASCTYNIFNPETQYNEFEGLIFQNSFEVQTSANEMRGSSYQCNFGFGWKSNKTEELYLLQCGTICEYNRFGARISTVSIGNGFKHNTVTNLNGTALGNSVIGNNVQQNLINGMQTNMNLPDGFQFNSIKGVFAAGTTFAINSSRNTFNNDFGGGTVAIPLNLNNCVFNKPVSGMQMASTAVVFNGVISNVSITNKTFPLSLTNETIAYTSADGSLWINGIDNTGHLQPEKIA